MKYSRFYLLNSVCIVLALVLFQSCDQNRIFEEYKKIPSAGWSYENQCHFDLSIEDTAQRYDVYIKLRHHFAFEWRNIWVKVATTYPDSSVQESSVNLPLSEADGHWFGRCTGDVCDISILIQRNAIFPAKGKYIFTISQDMRQNPLKNIIDVGFRIEKSASNN